MKLPGVLVLTTLLGCATLASASPTFFGNASPTGNFAAWSNSVTSLSGTINSTINFDTHPTGALNPVFYPGITITPVGDSNSVQFGAGPGQGNISLSPLSVGEGTHSASNFIFDGGNASSLTFSFAAPVLGFGLNVIDYFNPAFNNPLTLHVYDGVNGTGNLLGSMSSVGFNFQRNNLYFMGVTDDSNTIRSVVFTDVNSAAGDITGIDEVVYATAAPSSVPEPSSFALVCVGLILVAARRRK